MSFLDSLSEEEAMELPMIDFVYHYLQEQRKPIDFYTIMDKMAEFKGWTDKEKQEKLIQAYTDMNIDGQFVSLGDNQWGLKSWYPVEQTEEELATTIKPRKRKKVEDDIDEDIAGLEEDELDEFDEELEMLGEEAEEDLLDEGIEADENVDQLEYEVDDR